MHQVQRQVAHYIGQRQISPRANGNLRNHRAGARIAAGLEAERPGQQGHRIELPGDVSYISATGNAFGRAAVPDRTGDATKPEFCGGSPVVRDSRRKGGEQHPKKCQDAKEDKAFHACQRSRVKVELTRPGFSPVATEKLPDTTSNPYCRFRSPSHSIMSSNEALSNSTRMPLPAGVG